MSASLPNYLRTHRKRQALSLDEMADLLGLTGAAVSRHERGDGKPSYESVIAYRFIHRASIGKLFAGDVGTVEGEVRKRARKVLDAVKRQEPSAVRQRKLGVLSDIANRQSA